MSPEERILLVPKTYGRLHKTEWLKEITRTLQDLGHSREEIKAMLPTEGMDN
jgi:hypothetical protein